MATPDTEKELCILNDVFRFVFNKGFQERRGAPCEERKGSRRWGGGKGEKARMSRDPLLLVAVGFAYIFLMSHISGKDAC